MRTDHDEKRNPRDLLGIGDSDAEEIQSSDEEDGRSRATNISRPRVKRQRLESTRTDENETDNDDEESKGERKECQESEGGVVDERFSGKLQNSSFSMDPEKASNVDTSTADDDQFITNPSKLKPLTKEELAASKAATAKTGVVYLSRIPPFMKPQKVRDLLARFGTIGRVFLTPENSKTHTKRVRFGGNKKRNFVEGWVEFSNKKDAKLCAETLNTNNIGGKKGSYYYDDVWNIKYLPKFKWHHLQAQIGKHFLIFYRFISPLTLLIFGTKKHTRMLLDRRNFERRLHMRQRLIRHTYGMLNGPRWLKTCKRSVRPLKDMMGKNGTKVRVVGEIL
jgi:ESF2/ABP1 family protein